VAGPHLSNQHGEPWPIKKFEPDCFANGWFGLRQRLARVMSRRGGKNEKALDWPT
jgi:hypothetical protein